MGSPLRNKKTSKQKSYKDVSASFEGKMAMWLKVVELQPFMHQVEAKETWACSLVEPLRTTGVRNRRKLRHGVRPSQERGSAEPWGACSGVERTVLRDASWMWVGGRNKSSEALASQTRKEVVTKSPEADKETRKARGQGSGEAFRKLIEGGKWEQAPGDGDREL